MTENNTFIPTWASAPGDTIADLLDERGWSQSELADRLGFTKKHVSKLVNGDVTITAETAQKLSRVLGSTTDFWMVREAQYRAALQRNSERDALDQQTDWLREIPAAYMKNQGWIADVKTKADKVAECLRFFGVASVEAWRTQYEEPVAAFRRAQKAQTQIGAVAAWIRRAESVAEAARCGTFDKSRFIATLHELRAMTPESDPSVFVPKLTAACAKSGVAVVFVPRPAKCPVSGVTKWMSPERALIALSLRYKSNDQLWFTFFHEAGHVLLHGKRLVFVEVDDGSDAKEHEANNFARDILIPPQFDSELKSISANASKAGVVAFAKKIGVAPGIVVGRLQKEGWLPYTHLNQLKVRYEWA